VSATQSTLNGSATSVWLLQFVPSADLRNRDERVEERERVGLDRGGVLALRVPGPVGDLLGDRDRRLRRWDR
jgi:hypothetical protein